MHVAFWFSLFSCTIQLFSVFSIKWIRLGSSPYLSLIILLNSPKLPTLLRVKCSIPGYNGFATLSSCFPSFPFPHLYSIFCVTSSFSVSSHSSPWSEWGVGRGLVLPRQYIRDKRLESLAVVLMGRKGTEGSGVKESPQALQVNSCLPPTVFPECHLQVLLSVFSLYWHSFIISFVSINSAFPLAFNPFHPVPICASFPFGSPTQLPSLPISTTFFLLSGFRKYFPSGLFVL